MTFFSDNILLQTLHYFKFRYLQWRTVVFEEFQGRFFLDVRRYFCPEPDIDSSTQAAVGCTVNHTVKGRK